MQIFYAPEAEQSMADIWEHSRAIWGEAQADSYLLFLRAGVQLLTLRPERGKAIVGLPSNVRYVQLKKPRARHGHMVIYRYDEVVLEIIDFFHSAQDWAVRLKEKKR